MREFSNVVMVTVADYGVPYAVVDRMFVRVPDADTEAAFNFAWDYFAERTTADLKAHPIIFTRQLSKRLVARLGDKIKPVN
jgi:hypothetical protein